MCALLVLLKKPNENSPMNSEIANIMKKNMEEYEKNAREHTKLVTL